MIDLKKLAAISGLHPEAAPSLIHAAAVHYSDGTSLALT